MKEIYTFHRRMYDLKLSKLTGHPAYYYKCSGCKVWPLTAQKRRGRQLHEEVERREHDGVSIQREPLEETFERKSKPNCSV